MNRKRGIKPHAQWSPGPRKRIKTTMYNLVSVLDEEVEAGAGVMVPFIVLDMMEKGLLKFIPNPNPSK
jgi:hypothetical protein